MPYVIRRPHKRAFIALVAACFALLATAHTAAAATPCPTLSVSQVFAPLGDTSDYSLLPGATFEGDMSGWFLDKAAVVPGNEPWHVSGATDSHSLGIEPGGFAVSPMVCVSDRVPIWRLFALARSSSPSTTLHLGVLWGGLGHGGYLPLGILTGSGYSSWQPTPPMLLGKFLPRGVHVQVRFVFTADARGAGWSIDDVYLDPYSRG
jgi:hypothetical protein